MITYDIHLEFTEAVLGTASSDPKIHERYIASKAPDAESLKEEVEAIGVDAVEDRSMTRFPHMEDGTPFLWDYQLKGFCKDACKMMRYASDSASKKVTNYLKKIDGCVFPTPRMIVLHIPEGMEAGSCQRPLRAQTAMGERIALANSEELPAGTSCDFKLNTLIDEPAFQKAIVEWFQYGRFRGIGQWRNSGKGRFGCVMKRNNKVVLDTLH